jgi:hypothetical protein
LLILNLLNRARGLDIRLGSSKLISDLVRDLRKENGGSTSCGVVASGWVRVGCHVSLVVVHLLLILLPVLLGFGNERRGRQLAQLSLNNLLGSELLLLLL